MPGCERCWAEYTSRLWSNPHLTYSEVVAERDAEGGCSPEEQCGDLHIVIPGAISCRCGKILSVERS